MDSASESSTMPIQSKRIVLSRFFNNNVKLVANMCSICYEECIDVRILSINLNFLKQTASQFENTNFKDFNFLNISPVPVVETENNNLGFSSEEIDMSISCAEKVNKIINTKQEIINKLEESCANLKTVNSNSIIFRGFSVEDIRHSYKDYKKVVKTCEQTRFKIYKRISLRIVQNIYSNRRNKKFLRKNKTERTVRVQEESKYFKTELSQVGNVLKENHSKFFSISVLNNNTNTAISIKEECRDLGLNVKTEKCEHFKLDSDVISNSLKTEPNIIDYESEYVNTPRTQFMSDTKKIKVDDCFVPKREGFEDEVAKEKIPIWIPPRSPHNLIEELLYHDPWALLVATIFLNRTSCMCARPYVFWFLKDHPDPFKVLEKYPGELEKYFVGLGLQKTRAVQVWRMSNDFVYKNWTNVKDLYGIGDYGQTAFRMFCLGDFSVEPKDRFLRIYKAWYEKVVMKGPV